LKKLDINELNVGDKVGVLYYDSLGTWNQYYSSFYKIGTITKITPKKNKVYVDDKEISICNLYEICDEMRDINKKYDYLCLIAEYLYKLRTIKCNDFKVENLEIVVNALTTVVDNIKKEK